MEQMLHQKYGATSAERFKKNFDYSSKKKSVNPKS